MQDITLIIDDKRVRCTSIEILPCDVAVGDYIMCPHSGLIHIHGIDAPPSGFVKILDCEDNTHFYHPGALVSVARPKYEHG